MATGQYTAADLTPATGQPAQTGQYSAADIGTPAPSPQPSAPWRFATSFNRAASPTDNPADVITGPAYAVQHPLDSLSLIGNAIGNAQGDLLSKAKAAWQQGDYKGAIQHAINYLIPLAGPALDQAGEQMKSGDIAGGLGTTAGVAAPVLAGSPEGRAAIGRVGDLAAPVVKTAGNLADVASLGTLKKAGSAIAEGYEGVKEAAAGPKYRLVPRSNPLPDQSPAAALADVPTPATQPAAQTGEALASVPSAPWRIKPQAAALADVPTPATQPAAQTGEALASVPSAPWRIKPQAATLTDAAPASKAAVSQQLDDTLRTAVGNQPLKPGVPIRYQFKSAPPAASVPAEGSDATVPEGHTAVEGSSAVKSFMYDPDAQEMHIAPTKGYTHVYGDVSPDQAQAFQDAESKGRAWGTLRNSPGVTHVAKIMENGTRVAIKPTDTGEDLTGVLQQSVDAAQKAKWKMKAAQ